MSVRRAPQAHKREKARAQSSRQAAPALENAPDVAPVVATFRKRASARQCREHRWLGRRRATAAPPRRPEPVASTSAGHELDVTKDNLRLFVERWREHPDSPYSIEAPLDRRRASASLRGHSPSPCGSVCSSSGESQSPDAGSSLLTVPVALERRASEGRADKPKIDPASQILLAEEIIRLSEHLRAIAVKPPAKPEAAKSRSAERPKPRPPRQPDRDVNEISEKLSDITRQRRLNGTAFNGSRNLDKYSSPSDSGLYTLKRAAKPSGSASAATTPTTNGEEAAKSMDLTPPWRQARAKRRFGETCRDVPRIARLQDLHKSMNLDEPACAKNLLLKLIDEWGGLRRPGGSAAGRNSISLDWCEDEAVAKKSINSLAEYFQSEQKKVAATPATSSVHR